jgi:D-aspartate ligase
MNIHAPAPAATSTMPRGAAPGALILGGAHGSLAVARSLGRHGIKVCFLTDDHPIAQFSRYAGRRPARARAPTWPGPDDRNAASWLIEFAHQQGLDGAVLLVGSDAEMRFVAQHHPELSKIFRLTTPPWETAQWAYDKRLTHARAQAIGIDCPWSRYPRDAQEIAALDCRFPVILKPTVREGINAFTLAKAWRADDRDALASRYAQAAALVGEASIVLQEMIPGGGANQFSYAALWDRGEPVASLVARRSRQYPIDFGYTSTYVETVERADVEDAACRFLRSLDYDGLVEIEFKYDTRDRRMKILDVNARIWTWIALGDLAGVDFPYLLWQQATGAVAPATAPAAARAPVAPARGRAGVAWMHASRDLAAAAQEFCAGNLSPGDYLSSLRKPKVFAAFAADDPLPGLIELPLVAARVVTRRLPIALRRLGSRVRGA